MYHLFFVSVFLLFCHLLGLFIFSNSKPLISNSILFIYFGCYSKLCNIHHYLKTAYLQIISYHFWYHYYFSWITSFDLSYGQNEFLWENDPFLLVRRALYFAFMLKDIFDEYEILHEKFPLSLPHYFEDTIPLSLACIVFEEKSTLLFLVCQTVLKKWTQIFHHWFPAVWLWCALVWFCGFIVLIKFGDKFAFINSNMFSAHTLSSPSDCRYSQLLHIILQVPEALFFF